MTVIVAEIGVNHDGDVGLAECMIIAMAEVGADAVKCQLFDCEKLEPPGERREILRKLALTQEDMRTLQKVSKDVGIEFICTPFDVDSLHFLTEELMLDTIKISSADLGNKELLHEVDVSDANVVLSTGMATMADIAQALVWVPGASLLHCTSTYPTPLEDVNLAAMVTMREALKCPVGLSDHSLSTVVPAAAVALGAHMIEKHLTIDRTDTGPDHHMSLMLPEFSQMIKHIRDVEAAMGDWSKQPRASEQPVMDIAEARRAHRCKS
jgi:N,N'-diacetyllegionaminate synthase